MIDTILKRVEIRENKPNCNTHFPRIVKTNNYNSYQKLKTFYLFVRSFRRSFDGWPCGLPRRTRVLRPTSSWRCPTTRGCCRRSRSSRAALAEPRSWSWCLWGQASSLRTTAGRRSLWKGLNRLKRKARTKSITTTVNDSMLMLKSWSAFTNFLPEMSNTIEF